jgi:hypothetical protein
MSIPNLVESSLSNSQPHSQSILKVDLRAEQNFGTTPIQKISVPFKREEDMILLCLSTFLHDFVHDYNLSSMHKRVIKGDAYKVFQSLNIGIRNPTFKLFSYNTGSYGDVELYDDSKFEDVPVVAGSKLGSYLKFVEENKLEIPIQAGGLVPRNKPDAGDDGAFDDLDKFEYSDKFGLKPDLYLEKEAVPEDFLTYPIVSDFTSSEMYKTLIDNFSGNADFLGFHSALNTFVVTYLGSNLKNEAREFSALVTPEIEPKSIEMHNLSMFNYILCSIDGICLDFSAYSEKPSDVSTDLSFFADVFRVLRRAFVSIFEKINNNLKTDPLLILNSSSVLQQFIIYYSLFLNQSDMAEFDSILQKQSGGQGEEEEDEEDEEEKPPYMILDKIGEVETRAYPEGVDTYLAKPDKKIYLGTESIFITHNNLLTTIARGMFVKLGLWDKLFAGTDGYSKTGGTLYVFGIKEMDFISYDKLAELFPPNSYKGGNFNNELLIMQILILKNLLIEMSPTKTLTFGAKIDDQLKNYLDVFYNTYFVSKTQKTDAPPVQMDEDVLNNPNPEASIGSDTASLLASSGNEEDEEVDPFLDDEDDLSGGDPNDKEIEMVEFKKQEPTREPEPEPDSVQEPAPDSVQEAETELVEQLPEIALSNDTIVEPGRPPAMPIIFKNLKKMYQNNIYSVQNLKGIKIPPIDLGGTSGLINNLYDLLAHNETLIHRSDSQFNIPAPALKFVINNAANIAANINGSKMLYTKKDKDEMKKIVDEVKEITDFNDALERVIEEYNAIIGRLAPLENREKQLKDLKRRNRITIREYNELLQTQFDVKKIRNTELVPCENKKYLIEKVVKLNNEGLQKGAEWLDEWSKNCEMWLNQCQALFGLYRNLARGTFCPTVSMMDAMFNCSLKYKATEPKEVGTTNFELKYENENGGRSISFGGVVLNYNESVNGVEQLNAKIDFDLVCIDRANGVNDVANISTTGMQVAESHDLKASVVYKSVVDKIKELYFLSFGISTEEDVVSLDIRDRESREKFLEEKINRMWSSVQMYNNTENFNKLLGATAVKTFGDFLQECMACMKWGGYVNSTDQFTRGIKNFILENGIVPIYRSVSEPNKIVPYDFNGNALRLGIQGDRPSGFRSIYILMNGDSGINEYSIGGYVYTSANQKASRSILVSRNFGDELENPRKDRLRGKVIYVTRELPIIREDRDRYLKSLQYKTIRERKTFIDKVTKEPLEPEIGEPTIEGTSTETGYTLAKPPTIISSLEDPYKTSNYNEWDDYETPRVLTETKNKLYDFIDPREAAKAEARAKKTAAAAEERERLAAEKAAERAKTNSELYGMREEEKGTRGYMKSEGEVEERNRLLSSVDLTPPQKARLTILKKKYPNGGGSKRKRKSSRKRKLSHKRATSKTNRNKKNKLTRKHKLMKNCKRTKRRKR